MTNKLIECPHLQCNETMEMKKLIDHINNNNLHSKLPLEYKYFSAGILKVGFHIPSKIRFASENKFQLDFNILKSEDWKLVQFKERPFFLSLKYLSVKQLFLLTVISLEENKNVSDYYKLTITSDQNFDKKLIFTSPVLTINDFNDKNNKESDKYLCMNFEFFKTFLSCKILNSSHNLLVDAVTLNVEVEMMKK